ncbi:MAG TPA: chemotaxis response regulator protein-glutamate methylesterase [Fibrobacteria bacterium]|nr:chemotaxis response regulator protein-glutamate methylesterase [Fibrobacteria bacterium]
MSIQVLIVDDSAVVRQVLTDILSREPGIGTVATAPDPLFAMEKMKASWPDVVVLDVEMPRMDGISFLQKIMATRPTPVVICSSLAASGTEVALKALSAGAFAIVEKPKIGLRDYLKDRSKELASVVRSAAGARVDRMRCSRAGADSSINVTAKLSADEILSAPSSGLNVPMTEKIVAIGCSTGGTQALETVLTDLPRTSPGIVVVQHMPAAFTRGFADRLHKVSQIEVKEAENGDRVLPGRALIAPGGLHLMVVRSGAQYRVEVKDGPQVSRHKPSVDVLFRSVAKAAGSNATGFIMTGMGDDGARGMKEMHEAGAVTYAQDEETCVVFGMPKEAIKLGGVDHVVPLERIAGLISAIYARQIAG